MIKLDVKHSSSPAAEYPLERQFEFHSRSQNQSNLLNNPAKYMQNFSALKSKQTNKSISLPPNSGVFKYIRLISTKITQIYFLKMKLCYRSSILAGSYFFCNNGLQLSFKSTTGKQNITDPLFAFWLFSSNFRKQLTELVNTFDLL